MVEIFKMLFSIYKLSLVPVFLNAETTEIEQAGIYSVLSVYLFAVLTYLFPHGLGILSIPHHVSLTHILKM